MKKQIIDSIVVPIGNHTFEKIIKNKTYFFPSSNKTNVNLKYIFFYRVKPVQAITHYGVIAQFIPDAENMISIVEKAMTFKEPLKSASAYKFREIIKLKNKIPFDTGSYSIQGKINGIFEEIIKLKNTKGLFKR